MIGILQGVGAILGISGTLAFPRLRQRIGLEYTGTVGGVLQISALSLCLMSIFAPGSPFDPKFFSHSLPPCPEDTLGETSVVPLYAQSVRSLALASKYEAYDEVVFSLADSNSTDIPDCIPVEKSSSYLSISLLMAGVVGARFGKSISNDNAPIFIMSNAKSQVSGSWT